MAASISHNLKNPLGSIKTILQVQMESPELPGIVAWGDANRAGRNWSAFEQAEPVAAIQQAGGARGKCGRSLRMPRRLWKKWPACCAMSERCSVRWKLRVH